MKIPSFLVAASLLLVLGVLPTLAQEREASLTVTNGDFSDLGGLIPLPQPGWYSGVPTGWTASPPPNVQDGFYAVRDHGEAGFFANLHVLSRIKPEFHAFEQEVGVLAVTSDVTLTFESTGFKDEAFSMGVALADADGRGAGAILARANCDQDGAQRVVATKVPAGTRIAIRFWAVMGYPGIGHVAIEATPSP